MAIKSLKKYVLDKAKDAKNYVKKKTKPKSTATSVTATKPKSTATSVTATKPKSTATSVTAKATKVQPRQLDFNKAKISSAAIAGTGAGAGYIAGKNSGSKPAATRSAPTKGGGGGSQRTAPKYVEPKGGNIASRTDNSDGSKVGPNMSQVNKPDAKSTPSAAKTEDGRSTMQKLFGASEDKRAMGRNQMNAARKSMGMKKGGNVKKYKKGGSIDGCAVRGHTRAKRSR
jgi:hypothetical protein